ncbi:MAG: c-type cytochrome [Candidatus Sericytochromatia bacterium]
MRFASVFLIAGLLSLFLSAAQSSPSPVTANSTVDGSRVTPSIYQQQCSFCHQTKSLSALPDLAAWTRLIYTSGCPEVGLKLTEAERKGLKAYIEQMLKIPVK